MDAVHNHKTPDKAEPQLRIVERAVASIAFVVLLPMFGFAAFCAWLSVGRPIYFQQIRAGLNMQQLLVLKFRTMTDARDEAGQLLADHLRETKLSKIMRRFRLDELPQLISIARGEMSFVGPRPLLPKTVAAMGAFGSIRNSVLPGLAGWAQVNGNTLLTDQQKLALDLWYVANKSALLDGKILALTLRTLIAGERIDVLRISEAEAYLRTVNGLKVQM